MTARSPGDDQSGKPVAGTAQIDALEGTLASNHRALQTRGVPWMAGILALGLIQFFPPFLPVALAVGVVAFPVLTIAHAVALRLALVNPARRAFKGERTRRILTRWTCRFGYLAVAPAAYSTLTVPGLSAVVAPLAFFGLNFGVYRYLTWQRHRHSKGSGTHVLEKVVLGAVFLIAVTGLMVALAIALLFGVLVDWVV